jgi:hypothetical protein
VTGRGLINADDQTFFGIHAVIIAFRVIAIASLDVTRRWGLDRFLKNRFGR